MVRCHLLWLPQEKNKNSVPNIIDNGLELLELSENVTGFIFEPQKKYYS